MNALIHENNGGEQRTPRVSACKAPCAISSAEDRTKPLKGALRRNTAVCERRKESRIKARRRKRPPAKSLLPAVRAVDGDFQVVRSGVYLSEENAACCLVPAMPLFARD